MFGSKPFGSTGTSGAFGSTGSSLFGQTKPAGSSLFGSTTANTQAPSIFGQKPAGSSLFGSSTTQQPSSSLFGSNTANTTGTSLFGSTQNKPSLFGSTTAATTNTFGSPSTGTGLFGSSTTGGSMFGSSSTTNGTTVKFDPPISSDTMMRNGSSQNINTKHMCITAMKAYDGKSLEELRVEDYIANRKAPQSGAAGGTSLFGSTATSTSGGGLFGSNTPQKSIFGSANTTANTFGTSTTGGTSLFGSAQNPPQQSASIFGSKPATGGLFGSTTTSTFGSPSTNTGTSLFGSTQPQPTTFGQSTTSGGLFGGTGTSTFGAPATSQPSTGFSFGASTSSAPAFGGTSTNTGLFGSTNTGATTSGSLFGGAKPASGFSFGAGTTTTNTGFGASTTTGGGLFGSPSNKPLFGSTATTGTGLFGSTQPVQPAAGLFGSTQSAQSTSLFGSQPAVQPITASMPAQVAVAAAAPIVLGSDVNQRQIERALIEAQLAATPYGDGPLLKWMSKNSEDTDANPNPTNVQRQMKFLASKMSSPSMTVNGSLITSLAKPGSVVASPASAKSPLVIKDLAYSSSSRPPTLGRGLRQSPAMNNSSTAAIRRLNASKLNNSVDNAIDAALTAGSNRLDSPSRRSNIKYLDPAVMKEVIGTHNHTVSDPDELPRAQVVDSSIISGAASPVVSRENREQQFLSPSDQPAAVAIQRELNLRKNQPPTLNLDVSSADDSVVQPVQPVQPRQVVPVSSPAKTRPPRHEDANVSLHNEEYFCEPSVTAMREMARNGVVTLPDGLRVGRATYGSVFWPGPLTITDLKIDEIVVFRHKEVTVYPDENLKPPEGEGLNRPAEVTLERVWPIDKETKEDVRDPIKLVDMHWRERLERVTARMGATFKDYRPATGSWVFRVDHFSKYGLPDEESDDEMAGPGEVHVTRVNLALDEAQIQGLVQRQKVSLLPAEEVDMEASGGAGDGANRLSPSQLELSSICKDYLASFGNGLGGTRRDFEVPEKRLRLEAEEDEFEAVLAQSQRLVEKAVEPPCVATRKLALLHVSPAGRSTTALRPFADSTCPRIGAPVDVASAMGRVAPVRYAANGLFTHSLQPHSNEISIVRQQYPEDMDPAYLEDMLEHNTRLSEAITRNRSTSARVKHCELENQVSAPRIKPSHAFAELIDSYLATSKQSGRVHEQHVWELCKALFPAEKTESDEWEWTRTRLVGEWIRDCVSADSHPANKKKDVEKEEKDGGRTWAAITRGRFDKVPCGGENLFLMCSLLGMCRDARTRSKIQKQLDFWKENGHLDHIATAELKAYVIMSGRSELKWKGRDGKEKKLNVMEGLHWMQVLGLHIWFAGEDRAPLDSSVKRFVEDADAGLTQLPVRDVAWELLQLAIDGLYPVEKVLDAAQASSQWNIDYHLSWHLWAVVRSFGHSHTEPHSEQRLHAGYGHQLAALQLPHLAAFVMSHISNDQCRSAVLHQMLEAGAVWYTVEDYRRMLEVVRLPLQWIAAARAIKAKHTGQKERECELLLEAGDHSAAERLLCDHIAPNCVAADDWETLIHFANLFEEYLKEREGTGLQPQWTTGTIMYSEYLHLRQGRVDSDEEMVQLCDTIDARLERMSFKTPVQRMAVGTISRHVTEVRRGLTGRLNLHLMQKHSALPLSSIGHDIQILME